MTREEAIQIIKARFYPSHVGLITNETRENAKALRMAIEALSEPSGDTEENELCKAYSLVFQGLQKCSMFTGLYDAKNGSSIFMNGISTVMELIAYGVSEEAGDAFTDLFIKNMVKCEEEAQKEHSDTPTDLIKRADAVNKIKRYKHRLEGKGQTYGFLLEEFEHQIPSASTDGDLISRQDVVREIVEWIQRATDNETDMAIKEFLSFLKERIESPPSAEADSRVHCKNCKHRYMDGEVTHYYWCRLHDRPVDNTDYCAWGEESEVEE